MAGQNRTLAYRLHSSWGLALESVPELEGPCSITNGDFCFKVGTLDCHIYSGQVGRVPFARLELSLPEVRQDSLYA